MRVIPSVMLRNHLLNLLMGFILISNLVFAGEEALTTPPKTDNTADIVMATNGSGSMQPVGSAEEIDQNPTFKLPVGENPEPIPPGISVSLSYLGESVALLSGEKDPRE